MHKCKHRFKQLENSTAKLYQCEKCGEYFFEDLEEGAGKKVLVAMSGGGKLSTSRVKKKIKGMIEYNPVTNTNKFIVEYWHGGTNRFVRYWTYARGGMGILNEFRYYVMFFLGGLWTIEYIDIMGFHIPHYWLVGLAAVGIPMLIIAGRWQIYRANKPQEFINRIHGSITQYQSHNMEVLRTELLKEIAKKLKVDINKIEEKLSK